MTAGRVRSPTLGQRRFVHALVNGPKAFAIGWMLTPARQSVAPRESYSPCGRGPTRVLVMNDWLCDTSTWDGARQYLARSRFTFAFVDLRGYGRSTFASRAIHPSQGVQVRSILRRECRCDPSFAATLATRGPTFGFCSLRPGSLRTLRRGMTRQRGSLKRLAAAPAIHAPRVRVTPNHAVSRRQRYAAKRMRALACCDDRAGHGAHASGRHQSRRRHGFCNGCNRAVRFTHRR